MVNSKCKKGLTFLLLLLFLVTAVSAIEVSQTITDTIHYNVTNDNAQNKTVISFYNSDNVSIKTVTINYGSKLSDSLTNYFNITYDTGNFSGSQTSVDCGDQSISIPAITCSPSYTFTQPECPAIPACPALNCPECKCDNQPLAQCLDTVDKKLNPVEPQNDNQNTFWIVAIVIAIAGAIAYYYFNNKKGNRPARPKPLVQKPRPVQRQPSRRPEPEPEVEPEYEEEQYYEEQPEQPLPVYKPQPRPAQRPQPPQPQQPMRPKPLKKRPTQTERDVPDMSLEQIEQLEQDLDITEGKLDQRKKYVSEDEKEINDIVKKMK